jgi:hypothetical protein
MKKKLNKRQYQKTVKKLEKRFSADIPWEELPLRQNEEGNQIGNDRHRFDFGGDDD